ncbi:MAG TPA: hypothetical protein VIP77_04490 [Jiangellaceae bacterium]
MPSNVRFEPPSPAALAALAATPEMDAAMAQIAEAGRVHAESIAPVETGAFRSSFRVDSDGEGARLVNDDEGAAAIEHGSDDTPAHHTLAQTADWLEGGAS